ncbi:acyl-CoA dehydrogenase [Sphingomonas histidinilytica]|jgi:alkylation response protein AidB-like acyl-CoA dehydrogenase|uniref:acyl-CoA dehydrogenase family protein n=1 Tax=Rhizorhabdus histidinilytica TaxID=439228 RepID=UPI000F7AC60A|nr:acyl-CoA dehydrogenase family protein [Rhizorhabdus histidinilytica]MBO9376644.1 acyl-CoA dehydrogenase [Rhizorhabdus histidinilytica]QEH76905.1 acyl-CoA dehydrogenase [Sphingomonas sp. C8-2]
MDFSDTPEEAAYRARAAAFLDAHAADLPRPTGGEMDRLAVARRWQAIKADHGYACITWPREWGGAGGTAMEQVIFRQEEARRGVPIAFFGIGLGLCLPTVIRYAPAEQRERFVGPAIRGEQVWCQLFSEPAAGSDLAGVRTRAVRDGDDWILNGQKLWTSGAHYSDYGLLIARTDPDLPKHKGLTMFWVDLKAPGIEIRPIHQMSGGVEFNEVFFNDVRISDAQRLGEVGEGWKVAIFALMNERVEGGKDRGLPAARIIAIARATPVGDATLADDGAFRAAFADGYVRMRGVSLTRYRTLTAMSRGQTPGPEASIGKLVMASELQELSRRLIEAQGAYGLIDDEALSMADGTVHHDLLHAPGIRIAGGTDEILRNIIAERVLGLPAEPRVDKDIPFSQAPKGI